MWVNAFLDYLQYERNCSIETVQDYRDDLEMFRQFMERQGEDLQWQTIDGDIVRQWMVEMMERGNKPRSVCRRLSALRSFYKFLLRRGMVIVDPVHGISGPKKEKSLPTFIRESEMDQLLDHTHFPENYEGERDRLILMTLYHTGLRVSELVGLNLSDVDLAECRVQVIGKRNKQRIVPFGQELKDAMQAYLRTRALFIGENDINAVFLNDKGNARITVTKVQTTVRNYLSLVTTQQKKSPHVLRHSFATSMLNHHADLQSVKELLGHESLSTTEIYTHTTFEELKNMYNLAHPRA